MRAKPIFTLGNQTTEALCRCHYTQPPLGFRYTKHFTRTKIIKHTYFDRACLQRLHIWHSPVHPLIPAKVRCCWIVDGPLTRRLHLQDHAAQRRLLDIHVGPLHQKVISLRVDGCDMCRVPYKRGIVILHATTCCDNSSGSFAILSSLYYQQDRGRDSEHTKDQTTTTISK